MRLLIAILCAIMLSSCSTISGWKDAAALKAGYTSKARAEGILEQTKREYAEKLAANANDISKAQENATKGLKDEIQEAANSLYAAHLAAVLNPRPDRTHLVVDNKVVEAQVALKVAPTLEAMTRETAAIKRQLDETQTSLEQLRAEHEADLKQATIVSERATKAEADLAAAKVSRAEIEAAKSNEIAAKQALVDAAKNAVIAEEHKRGDDEAARRKVLEKMSLWLGLFSLVGIAAAIYLPVFRVQSAALGAVLGLAAVGIWYLSPLIVGVATLAVFVALGIWMARNHMTATKTTTALVNAVQDVKEKAPEIYASTIKPALTDWTTKYAKDASGATVAVPDKAVTANIDAQLVASNRV